MIWFYLNCQWIENKYLLNRNWLGFTESFSNIIKITDEKLKIGHIEYIFEVSINNQVQYFFQLQKFKKSKRKGIKYNEIFNLW